MRRTEFFCASGLRPVLKFPFEFLVSFLFFFPVFPFILVKGGFRKPSCAKERLYNLRQAAEQLRLLEQDLERAKRDFELVARRAKAIADVILCCHGKAPPFIFQNRFSTAYFSSFRLSSCLDTAVISRPIGDKQSSRASFASPTFYFGDGHNPGKERYQ